MDLSKGLEKAIIKILSTLALSNGGFLDSYTSFSYIILYLASSLLSLVWVILAAHQHFFVKAPKEALTECCPKKIISIGGLAHDCPYVFHSCSLVLLFCFLPFPHGASEREGHHWEANNTTPPVGLSHASLSFSVSLISSFNSYSLEIEESTKWVTKIAHHWKCIIKFEVEGGFPRRQCYFYVFKPWTWNKINFYRIINIFEQDNQNQYMSHFILETKFVSAGP